jgi:hypothetical protein
MQISGDIDLKRKRIVRLDTKQCRWSGAETLTRFG